MIQIEECRVEDRSRLLKFELGDGQKIESLMAVDLGLKIFKVRQGRCGNSPRGFDDEDANLVAKAVLHWYASGCADTSIEIVQLRSVR